MSLKNSKNTHLVIPDTQVKAGVPIDHLEACGNYIVDQLPNTIIHLGDHWDMPSLSSYEDKGSKYFHDKSYKSDVDSGLEAMELLLKPLVRYNNNRKRKKLKQYNPRMVFTTGNHEYRVDRAIWAEPILEGTISQDHFQLDRFGWETYPYEHIIEIDGISYCHLFRNPDSLKGNPLGGTMDNRLRLMGHSFTMGHQQGRKYGNRFTGMGNELHGLVCGSFYQHDEDYLGPQKNKQYWRGIVVKHECVNGTYDPMFVSMEYLLREWR